MKQFLILAVIGILLSGCNMDKSRPNVELIQDMMIQAPVKPQEADETFDDGLGSRTPPEHTVPVGFKPYKFAKDLEGARKNPNPLSRDMSSETLLVGQKYYETQCALCHGSKLAGDGPVAAKMPLKPPALNTDKIRSWTDGQIYHVITVGQGVMGPYASHIPQEYRWQVVNYIRFLQKAE